MFDDVGEMGGIRRITPPTPREPGPSSSDGYGTVNEERMPDTSDDEEVLLPEVCFFSR